MKLYITSRRFCEFFVKNHANIVSSFRCSFVVTMPVPCVCQWQSCSYYSKAFEENKHVLSSMYSISYGARNTHVRAMIEQHLSVDDDVVKRKVVYRVAYNHWPEQLILRNMNEKRSISKLISRQEAGNYGNEFVDASIDLSDDSSQMFRHPLQQKSKYLHWLHPSIELQQNQLLIVVSPFFPLFRFLL